MKQSKISHTHTHNTITHSTALSQETLFSETNSLKQKTVLNTSKTTSLLRPHLTQYISCRHSSLRTLICPPKGGLTWQECVLLHNASTRDTVSHHRCLGVDKVFAKLRAIHTVYTSQQGELIWDHTHYDIIKRTQFLRQKQTTQLKVLPAVT